MLQNAPVFNAIADPIRRAILDRLRDDETGLPVNQIAGPFAVSRPAISKHLRILHQAHLVLETRQGRNRVYRLNPEPLQELDRWLEHYRRFWTLNLLSLKRHVESKGKKA